MAVVIGRDVRIWIGDGWEALSLADLGEPIVMGVDLAGDAPAMIEVRPMTEAPIDVWSKQFGRAWSHPTTMAELRRAERRWSRR